MPPTILVSSATRLKMSSTKRTEALETRMGSYRQLGAKNTRASAHACTYRHWQTRTRCCRHIVADTNVSPFARMRNICCGHKFCVRDTKNASDFVKKQSVSATNFSQFAQNKETSWTTICPQQCVLV